MKVWRKQTAFSLFFVPSVKSFVASVVKNASLNHRGIHEEPKVIKD
jgi:hypothetical protein